MQPWWITPPALIAVGPRVGQDVEADRRESPVPAGADLHGHAHRVAGRGRGELLLAGQLPAHGRPVRRTARVTRSSVASPACRRNRRRPGRRGRALRPAQGRTGRRGRRGSGTGPVCSSGASGGRPRHASPGSHASQGRVLQALRMERVRVDEIGRGEAASTSPTSPFTSAARFGRSPCGAASSPGRSRRSWTAARRARGRDRGR